MIRKLEAADYAAVLDLYTQLDRIHYETRPDYFGKRENSYPQDIFEQTIVASDSLMLGSFDGDTLLGIADATLLYKSGMIQGVKTVRLDNIYVLPQARRKGVARALFAAVESWAKEQGAVRLDLHVWDFNRDAMALYQAMGMDFQYHVMEKKL